MPWPHPIQEALAAPGGARFYRCALQVNPAGYLANYRGQDHGLDRARYVQTILAKCTEQGIQAIAITDHNHVGDVDLFRDAARLLGIVVFPGFELTSSEGIHVLCLHDPATPASALERCLGEFGIRDVAAGQSNPSTKTFSEILGLTREQHGIAVAAHATHESGGLLRVLKGQSRIKAWKDPHLLAVQIPGAIDEAPEDLRKILQNKNADYQRTPPASEDQALAVINSKDVCKPEHLQDPSASCWIKMSEVSVEGLRQAFLDPASRIRLSKDVPPEHHAEFRAIAWQGGFLDGVRLQLNENLNVLVGGRGAGKSTIIESLRCCLGLEPLGDEAKKAHAGVVQHVLQSGTKISLLIRSHTPSPRDYLIERTLPNPPTVKDEAGAILPLTALDLLPGLEVYGQHEISELARSPEKLTRLLSRFAARDSSIARQKTELRRELEKSRTRTLQVQTELLQLTERLAALPGWEETLKRFQEAGLEEKLKEQSQLVREEQILKTAFERTEPAAQVVEQLRRNQGIDRAFLSVKALDGLAGRELLRKADGVLARLEEDQLQVLKLQEEATLRANEGLSVIRVEWTVGKSASRSAFENTLRELQKSKIDGDGFLRLRRQIEEVRPLRERESGLKRDAADLEAGRRKLLDEWEDVKAQAFRTLEGAAKKVTRQLEGSVRVRLAAAGDRAPLSSLLRGVGGRLAEAIDQLERASELSLPALAAALREGAPTLATKFGVPIGQAQRIAQAGPEFALRLEELDLPPTAMIELNVASEDQPEVWRSLEELSTGQKATAVLLLLLLESDAPLVVDQPEDDLDNRFIADSVVRKMREEKRRRQFIFATHNANIPVLGDAELIAGLRARGEANGGTAEIPREQVGSIDAAPVRELVEELLEGGKAAFEMRRRKYGF